MGGAIIKKKKRGVNFIFITAIGLCILAGIFILYGRFTSYLQEANVAAGREAVEIIENKVLAAGAHSSETETPKLSDYLEEDKRLKDSRKNNEKKITKTETQALAYAIPVEDAMKADGKKIAFLTFDDGPSKSVTPEVLKILDKYNIKATFFVIGDLAIENKSVLQEEYKKGHAIANHSFSHNYKNLYSNIENFKNEVESTDKVLKNILGSDFTTKVFRFPGGSFEEYKSPYRGWIVNNGYHYIDWNALNGDAEGLDISSDKLVKRLIETVQGKSHAVILMHDAGAKTSTVQALPAIIEYLIKSGYEFRVLK